jgi:hypothetical protein
MEGNTVGHNKQQEKKKIPAEQSHISAGSPVLEKKRKM